MAEATLDGRKRASSGEPEQARDGDGAADDASRPDISASDRQALIGVARRIDTHALAVRAVEAFREEIEGFRRLPEAVLVTETTAVVQAGFDLVLHGVFEGREPTDEDLEPFREAARAHAREVPVADLLRSYHLASGIGWQALLEEADPAAQDALLRAARLVMEHMDSVSAAAADAHREALHKLAEGEDPRLRELLEALVAGGPLRPSLHEAAARIGFPIADRYIAFVAALPGEPPSAHKRLAFDLAGRGVLAVTDGNRIRGLAAPEADLRFFDARVVRVAIGDPVPSFRLADALKELNVVHDVAGRLGLMGDVRRGSLLPELLVASSPGLASSLCARVLEPLERVDESRGPDLRATLEAFIGCDLDRRRTAASLHVHPNTLDYRLRRIAELTELDLHSCDGLIAAGLALKACKLGVDQDPRA